MSGFRVVMAHGGAILSTNATPRLISEGGGDAYCPEGSGFWRLRDDKYDPPGTTYTRVSIVRTEDYAVDVHITVIEKGHEDEPIEYDDTFHVVAANDTEASHRAMEQAGTDIEERYGDDCSHGVEVRKVRRDAWF